MLRRFGLALATGTIALIGLMSRFVRRYRVEGRSMLSAYAPDDRLVVETLTYGRRAPRVGEVVVVRQPGGRGRLDLKRVFAGPGARVTVRGESYVLGKDEWFVVGDNLDESADSRQLGPVRRGDIVGRIWMRY